MTGQALRLTKMRARRPLVPRRPAAAKSRPEVGKGKVNPALVVAHCKTCVFDVNRSLAYGKDVVQPEMTVGGGLERHDMDALTVAERRQSCQGKQHVNIAGMNDSASIGKREAVAEPWKVRPPSRPRQPTIKYRRALPVETAVGPFCRLDLMKKVIGPADVAEMFQLHVQPRGLRNRPLARDATPARTGP